MKTAMQVPQVKLQNLWRPFSLCLLLGVLTSACSKEAAVDNSSPANLATVPMAASRPTPIMENAASPGPKDKVLFDGKNYIKKNGWKVPPRKDLYKDETDNDLTDQRTTKSGKRVITTTTGYIYKTPWLYSQNFYFEGSDLDSMKGQLESMSFLEMSVNGKIFFYSIFTERVVSPTSSNNDPHEDPFRYRIMDTDGDGIFETLLVDDGEIVVPDWVLR